VKALKYLPAAQVAAVFTDIDDTLTTGGKLDAATYAALEALKRAGLLVIPVTGRPAGWCDLIARLWPVDGVIGENGALYMWHDRESGVLRTRHLLDDAQRLRVAPGVGADGAGVDGIEVAAQAARPHGVGRLRQRPRQRHQHGVAPVQHVQRRPPGRAGPEAGEPGQQLDQALDLGAGHGQNGSFSPPGSCRPPVTSAIFSWVKMSSLTRASLMAATIRSSSTSGS